MNTVGSYMYSESICILIPKLDSDIEKLKQYFYINQYVTILFRRGKLVKLLSVEIKTELKYM